ncbi:hypothetical protein KA093_01530 [Candidatus Saccharibacteria bacterium]|nr:hypothetical protein [Candidatus Saccharibacteria bacterium]
MGDPLSWVLIFGTTVFLFATIYRFIVRDKQNDPSRIARLKQNFGVQNIQQGFPIDQSSEEIIQGVFDTPIQAYNQLLEGDTWLYIQVTSLTGQDHNFNVISPWSVTVFARRLDAYFPSIACVHAGYSIRQTAYIRAIENGQLVLCEGIISKDYRLYAQPDMRLDALSIFTPEVLKRIPSSPAQASLMLRKNILYYILPGNLAPEEMLESLLAHSNDLSVALVENAHRWAASAANHDKLQSIIDSELGVALRELDER